MPFFFSSSSIITIKSSSSRRLIHPSHQAMALAKQRVLKITLNLKQQIIIFFLLFFFLWIIARVEFICASEETVLNEFQDVNALYIFSFILSIPPLQCFYLSVNFQCLKEANICPRIIRINEQKKEYFLRDFVFSKEKAFRILISSSILIYCICMVLVKEVKGEKGMK